MFIIKIRSLLQLIILLLFATNVSAKVNTDFDHLNFSSWAGEDISYIDTSCTTKSCINRDPNLTKAELKNIDKVTKVMEKYAAAGKTGTYVGSMSGISNRNSSFTGDINLKVDFANQDIRGSVDNMKLNGTDRGSLNVSIRNESIPGFRLRVDTGQGANGYINGSFSGKKADQMSGDFNIGGRRFSDNGYRASRVTGNWSADGVIK